MAEGKDLLTVLWSGADVLRGKMDANEYKTYLLGLDFFISSIRSGASSDFIASSYTDCASFRLSGFASFSKSYTFAK